MTGALRTIPDGWQSFLEFSGFDFICEVDRDARYLHLSPNYATFFEYRLDQLLGRSPLELGLIHPEDLPGLQEALAPLFERNEPVKAQYRVRSASGAWHWMDSAGNPARDAEGHWRAIFISRDITERRLAEEALARQETAYRDLVEHAVDAILLGDSRGRIIQANSRAVAMTGYDRDELLGLDIKDLFPADEMARAPLRYDLLGQGLDVRTERWLRAKDGQRIPIEMSTRRLPDGRYQAFLRDMSERHQLEAGFKAELAFLREVINRNPMSLQILDHEGRTLQTNPAFLQLFGSVPPPGYSIFADPQAEAQGLGKLLQRLRGGEPVFFPEFRYNAGELDPALPDKPVWIRMVAFPAPGQDGRPGRFVLMHEDVTERRRSEQALRESEAQNRALLSAMPDLIFLNRKDGEFLAYHAADPGNLFAPPEAFMHLQPEQVFPAPFAEKFRRAFSTALASGAIQHLSYSLPMAGQDCHFEARIVPCTEDTFLTIIRDITEDKRNEALLQQTQKLESLGVLAGGIAHDFNNLLTAVMGNLNLAQLKLLPAAPAQPHLEAIEKIVLKASDLTRQMLAYSGKGRFVVKHHDLNEVVSEMGHLLQVSISKKVALTMVLAEGLPAIEGDATQIQQVIMNLVTNASDAIGDADGRIAITTREEVLDSAFVSEHFPVQPLEPGRYATLEVSDSGSGIDPAVLPKIFDPFFSTKSSGRGLGLSAMQGILRGHGAGLRITSAPGQGTTFKVYFPIRAAATSASGPAAAAAPAPGQLRGLVLVVDDEPTILETLRGSMEAFGLEVITAQDGLDALERFQAEPRFIDLVLMDLTMPRMDGREAFRRLQQLRPGVRVLLSSGYNQQESIQEFQGRGLAGFLQKPYRLADLRKALVAALGVG